jgi:drug/metabolite transporter (DMT)-like permease
VVPSSGFDQCVYIGNMAGNSSARAASIVGLLSLSLLWAVGMLRADLLPGLIADLLPYLQKQAISFASLTILTGLAAVLRREQWPFRRLLWDSVFVGLGLFVVPLALVTVANGWVPGLAQAALFTLTPVFALVFEPYIGNRTPPQSRGGLIASLASFAGALCVFPVSIPASIQAGLGLCVVILATACVAAANCKAVAVAREFREYSAATWAATAGATAAIALTAASTAIERPVWKWDALRPELLWSTLIEVPALLLLFWLMRRMSAARTATRYVIAPLLAILVGAGLMRAPLMPRTWLGLMLMAAGAAWLLFAPEAKPELEKLSLR